MNYTEKLDKILAETEEQVQENRKALEEEIGEFEHPELEAVKPENSGKAQRYATLLDFYQKRLEDLEAVQEGLQNLDTEVIENTKEELDDEHPRSSDNWDEEAKNSNRASLLLKNAVKLVKGEEYDPKLGGLESDDRYPEKGEIKPEKGRELEEARREYVQIFLNSSSLLKKKGDLENAPEVEEKDLEQVEEINQEIEEIRDELKQRAEDVNAMLLKASKKLEELEN